jgi:hypothetical protein
VPRKVFVAGEILTAADVNTNLMDQAVMSFADSAARGSAIPSPVEGMVSYLQDVDRWEGYTTAWGPIGSIVSVKSQIFTGTQALSLSARANDAITNLSISHAVQNSSNKLLLIASVGVAGSSTDDGRFGLAVADNGALLGIGDAAGTRIRVSAGGSSGPTGGNTTNNMTVQVLHTPGDTASHTYTARAINIDDSARTLTVNRSRVDSDINMSRGASTLTLIEVVG